MTEQDHIRMLASTISEYIDVYDGISLGAKEKRAVISAREMVIESLEFVKTGSEDSKAHKKIIKKLDDSFTNVIAIFNEANIASPEIMETLSQQSEEPGTLTKKTKKAKKAKKAKVEKAIGSKDDIDALLGELKSQLHQIVSRVNDIEKATFEMQKNMMDIVTTTIEHEERLSALEDKYKETK